MISIEDIKPGAKFESIDISDFTTYISSVSKHGYVYFEITTLGVVIPGWATTEKFLEDHKNDRILKEGK